MDKLINIELSAKQIERLARLIDIRSGVQAKRLQSIVNAAMEIQKIVKEAIKDERKSE